MSEESSEELRGDALDENRERAAEVITQIRGRLLLLAVSPPFRFVNTYRDEADDYLRRMTEFVGFDEDEVAAANHAVGPFPGVYEEFLRQMGHARGALFAGSEIEPYRLLLYRHMAEEMMSNCGVERFLDADSVVFMTHQGYSFCYFQSPSASAFDAPVFQYVECEPAPKQIAPGFAEFLDAEVRLMEENDRMTRESGGYFITVSGGFERRLYPALDEGRRPLDCEDELL
ncbi:MAG: SMI1/KNR4 family protein [Acidobacteria bacterium]|nr:SMI1/KNR4 family protein [Acidobacteriota bacterium]